MTIMGIKLSKDDSTPRAGYGQSVRIFLEDALPRMVSYHGDNWSTHLGTNELSHSTLVSKSAQLSPF